MSSRKFDVIKGRAMPNNEKKQNGCHPLREGYQPGNNQGQQIITPPKGGTGEVVAKNQRLYRNFVKSNYKKGILCVLLITQ